LSTGQIVTRDGRASASRWSWKSITWLRERR